ncbi:DMT family transporter [Enterovirga sp.]|uniref:DMT family transporter n=1 Tax=Enterovirga sp. TaxID=2026350 RepID=UPI002614CD66|nr:DMT family transporter [Enterovirga sp.]MDB5590869.1 Permease [Enterovirga sp.]
MTPAWLGSLPRSQTARGIGLMLLGILIFSLNDVLGKWLVATYSVGQVLLFRSLAALLLLLPFLVRAGAWRITAGGRPGLQALRAVLSTAEVLLFYWAVVYLPLADAMTFWLAAPIYVAALSPVLLGDRIGWRRWAAIGVGFGGVLVALQPSAATLTWPAAIAMAGSVAFALMMVTGRLLKDVPDVTLVFWQTAGALAAGIVTAPLGWVTPTGPDLALLSLLGVVALAAHLCVNRSLKLADAATVTPFQYTLLLWAVLFGFVVFGDVPRPSMLVGAAVIVLAGLFILFRESRRRAPSPPVATGL